MNQDYSPIQPESVGRISQIIAGALIAGVVMFAGVAFFIAKGDGSPFPMMSFIAVGFRPPIFSVRASDIRLTRMTMTRRVLVSKILKNRVPEKTAFTLPMSRSTGQYISC